MQPNAAQPAVLPSVPQPSGPHRVGVDVVVDDHGLLLAWKICSEMFPISSNVRNFNVDSQTRMRDRLRSYRAAPTFSDFEMVSAYLSRNLNDIQSLE